MTRFMIVVIVSAALASAGCGGDDGSKDASGTTGAGGENTSTAGGTNPSTTGNPGSKPAGSKPIAPGGPKPGASRPALRRSEAFRRGRDTCRSQGVAALARKYHVRSSNPYRIAEAYAEKTYRPSLRPDGYEGCLLGLRTLAGVPSGTTGATSPSP